MATTGSTVPIAAIFASSTNVLSLTLTAPSAGFVWLLGTGYRNTPTNTVFGLGFSIAATAGAGWSFPDPRFSVTGTTDTIARVSFATSNVLPAVAGSNTYYLNS